MMFKTSILKRSLSIAIPFCLMSACDANDAKESVNHPIQYPVQWSTEVLQANINADIVLNDINPHIFGTNLEWFNNGGGLAPENGELRNKVVELVKEQNTSVMRYPGGTLADFYRWRDGIGPRHKRKPTKHPTDPGTSSNDFGTPEFFRFLKDTNSEALITVNAGTADAQEAADWVAYANQENHPLRKRDGFPEAMDIKLWEIGNELYLPGNPGERIITVTPEVYAQRYKKFAAAMKAVDPSITTIAIGVARSDVGPEIARPDWTKVLLENAASDIDMIAVHNAYFPMLYTERQPSVESVYPSLWASPEAVDRSLVTLTELLEQYEPAGKDIGIAITEWGALFSLPDIDNHWLDHVKTMGTGVYIARLMQVIMSNPRVELANYFKLVDRSFMGWISYTGKPKVPFWVLSLYSNYSGSQRIEAKVANSPTYNSPSIGGIMEEKNVAEVTVVGSIDREKKKIYLNFLNRSMNTGYPIKLNSVGKPGNFNFDFNSAKVMKIQAKEVTSHNGNDIPPEWPYGKAIEPYSSEPLESINIKEYPFDLHTSLMLEPFSMATIVVDFTENN